MKQAPTLTSEPHVQTRRVRFGLKGSKPKVFKWEPEKTTIAPKPKNSVEFKIIAKKELELALKFDNERASYDKYIDPDIVPPVEGSRQACGKRTTSLRKSGASSFEKVMRDAETLSCSKTRFQINPSSPISLNGTSKLHDLGHADASGRNSLSWDGIIGSEGYQAQWVPSFPHNYKPPSKHQSPSSLRSSPAYQNPYNRNQQQHHQQGERGEVEGGMKSMMISKEGKPNISLLSIDSSSDSYSIDRFHELGKSPSAQMRSIREHHVPINPTSSSSASSSSSSSSSSLTHDRKRVRVSETIENNQSISVRRSTQTLKKESDGVNKRELDEMVDVSCSDAFSRVSEAITRVVVSAFINAKKTDLMNTTSSQVEEEDDQVEEEDEEGMVNPTETIYKHDVNLSLLMAALDSWRKEQSDNTADSITDEETPCNTSDLEKCLLDVLLTPMNVKAIAVQLIDSENRRLETL